MNKDMFLALDRAIAAALEYTVDTMSALLLSGDWAKAEESSLGLQKAAAVLEWECEKATRDRLYSATAVYDDQTVALLLGGAGEWPEFPDGTVFLDRSANTQ